MELGLKGKSVLITGGSKGLGFACAKAFAGEGVRTIHIVARNANELDDAATRIKDAHDVDVVCHRADLTSKADLNRIGEACADVDILINNAGSTPRGKLLQMDEDAWRQGWELKVFGYINLTRLIYRRMVERKTGVVINIIGVAGELPRPEYILGCSGNSALMTFTRSLGAESVDHGIRVIGVNPGRVLTDRQLGHMRKEAIKEFNDPERWPEIRDRVAPKLPFGRYMEPRDVSDLVLFLTSERAAYMSATVVTLDGGSSLRPRP